jgi:periplasmic protein TonB
MEHNRFISSRSNLALFLLLSGVLHAALFVAVNDELLVTAKSKPPEQEKMSVRLVRAAEHNAGKAAPQEQSEGVSRKGDRPAEQPAPKAEPSETTAPTEQVTTQAATPAAEATPPQEQSEVRSEKTIPADAEPQVTDDREEQTTSEKDGRTTEEAAPTEDSTEETMPQEQETVPTEASAPQNEGAEPKEPASKEEPASSKQSPILGRITTVGAADPNREGGNREAASSSGSAPGEVGNTGSMVPFESLAKEAQIPKPGYPQLARRWGHEGVVVVRIVINEDGSVKDTVLLQSSGHAELDEAAVEVVEQRWRFEPPGREITTVKEFNFRLRR